MIVACRGQAYDSGWNMIGHDSGVQTRLLEMNNRAQLGPCDAHTLNVF